MATKKKTASKTKKRAAKMSGKKASARPHVAPRDLYVVYSKTTGLPVAIPRLLEREAKSDLRKLARDEFTDYGELDIGAYVPRERRAQD